MPVVCFSFTKLALWTGKWCTLRQGQLFSDFESSNFQTNFILFDSISCWAAWFPLFVAFCHIHLVLMTFTSQMAPKRIRQSLPVTDLTLYLTLLCPCMLRFEIIKYYILYCKKKCIEEFPVCSGHTLPLSSYVLRETKSLDRVPLGSLQKCGNITTPAWLFVAQSPYFLFYFLPVLLVCCLLSVDIWFKTTSGCRARNHKNMPLFYWFLGKNSGYMATP